MKIYTKEQVKSMLTTQEMSLYEKIFTHDEIINMEDGIELPSDEKIEQMSLMTCAFKTGSESGEFNAALYNEFINGAKWMREQILNQNK